MVPAACALHALSSVEGSDVACFSAIVLSLLDRIYLNGDVPNLQVGGQVVTFLVAHLGRWWRVERVNWILLLAAVGSRERA